MLSGVGAFTTRGLLFLPSVFGLFFGVGGVVVEKVVLFMRFAVSWDDPLAFHTFLCNIAVCHTLCVVWRKLSSLSSLLRLLEMLKLSWALLGFGRGRCPSSQCHAISVDFLPKPWCRAKDLFPFILLPSQLVPLLLT